MKFFSLCAISSAMGLSILQTTPAPFGYDNTTGYDNIQQQQLVRLRKRSTTTTTELNCVRFTTGTHDPAAGGNFGFVAKDKEERVLSVGAKKSLGKGEYREYCHANLAIVDISTNNNDGWIGYVSMSHSGNDAEYSCTKGCTSLTGNTNLSRDKTIVIDQDMNCPSCAQVQCKVACRVQLKEPNCVRFTTGTYTEKGEEYAGGYFGYVAKDKEERVLSVGVQEYLGKGEYREYCHDDLAIVDISTNALLGFSDGWLGYVSMSDSGNAAEYSCTKGCTSLSTTGNILSRDKTIVIDQDMDWSHGIAQVQCKAACRVQINDKCPSSHPFAYLNGNYCCKTNKEKYGSIDGELCNGSEISIKSRCCEDNQYTRCPNPPCQNGENV